MPAPSTLPILILAAGLSRRAAPHNKLLSTIKGEPVVRATVRAFVDSAIGDVTIVTGHDRERIEAALHDLPARFIFAEDFAHGMGHSLAAGIRGIATDHPGFLISPGDLPELTPPIVRLIASEFFANNAQRHVIPSCHGDRGHPVAVGGWLRPQLEQLRGDIGARHLLATDSERAHTIFLPVGTPAILRDVDHLPSIASAP